MTESPFPHPGLLGQNWNDKYRCHMQWLIQMKIQKEKGWEGGSGQDHSLKIKYQEIEQYHENI